MIPAGDDPHQRRSGGVHRPLAAERVGTVGGGPVQQAAGRSADLDVEELVACPIAQVEHLGDERRDVGRHIGRVERIIGQRFVVQCRQHVGSADQLGHLVQQLRAEPLRLHAVPLAQLELLAGVGIDPVVIATAARRPFGALRSVTARGASVGVDLIEVLVVIALAGGHLAGQPHEQRPQRLPPGAGTDAERWAGSGKCSFELRPHLLRRDRAHEPWVFAAAEGRRSQHGGHVGAHHLGIGHERAEPVVDPHHDGHRCGARRPELDRERVEQPVATDLDDLEHPSGGQRREPFGQHDARGPDLGVECGAAVRVGVQLGHDGPHQHRLGRVVDRVAGSIGRSLLLFPAHRGRAGHEQLVGTESATPVVERLGPRKGGIEG